MKSAIMEFEPPKLGNSVWRFSFSLSWKEFISSIQEEIATQAFGWQDTNKAYVRRYRMRRIGAKRLAHLFATQIERKRIGLEFYKSMLTKRMTEAPDARLKAFYKCQIAGYESAIGSVRHSAWAQVTSPNEDRYYFVQEDGTVYLQDAEYDSSAIITLESASIKIKTAWSGFEYKFYDNEGHVDLVFQGPRRAVGQQNLLPLEVELLLGPNAERNPFEFLEGMWDANDDWFPSDIILGFYKTQGWELSPCFEGSDGWWRLNS